ncbi:MAG: LptF/LptG family permease [Bacteroidia bacterium]|nr:LptF/LptG family permease [Bacteroidia bacterium]
MQLKTLDRYIFFCFMKTFWVSIALILCIFIVFDIKEKIQSFTSNDIPLKEIIFEYYLMFIPYFANLFSHLFIFISVIFFTSRMANRNEFVAMLSGGISFGRILRPYLAGALFISSLSLVMNHFFLPGFTKRKIAFEDKYINDNYNTDEENIHRMVAPGVVLYMHHYVNSENTGYHVSLEKIQNQHQEWYMRAERMVWDSVNKCWNFYHGEERIVIYRPLADTSGKRVIFLHRIRPFAIKKLRMEFTPNDMWRYESRVEVMSTPELTKFIEKEKMKGSNIIVHFEVEKYRRTAFPYATLVLTVMGVCISSRKVRGGVGLQIAIGLILSCAYVIMMYVFTTLATTGFANPLFSVWIPNIIFTILAAYFYRTAQK